MKTWIWPNGRSRAALALGLVVCCGTAGCAFFPHRELTAPCSDYKAASFAPAGTPGAVPCDEALPMARPALDRGAGAAGQDRSGRPRYRGESRTDRCGASRVGAWQRF